MRELPTNICPLLAIAGIGTGNGPAVCLGHRCALACNRWNEHGDQETCSIYMCSLKIMAESLETLTDHTTGKLYGEFTP